MIVISRHVAIPDGELEITAIRAQGAGGQHVNKTSTAIHLRFDIRASSLPEYYKERLLAASHHLISSDGVIVIKAQEYRSHELNREAALARLVSWLFRRHYAVAFHGILGIVIASTLVIVPTEYRGVGEMALSAVCCGLGFWLAFLLARLNKKMK